MAFKSRIAILLAGCIAALPGQALARDFVVETPQCDTPIGTAIVQVDRADTFARIDTPDPTGFISAMVANSGCFDIVEQGNVATYQITAMAINKRSYNARMQNGQPARSATLEETLRGRMRYAEIIIKDMRNGSVVAEGAGRSHMSSGFDYSGWTISANQRAAVQSFNATRNGRKAFGAVINAYYDLAPNTFNASGSAASAGTPQSAASLTQSEMRMDYDPVGAFSSRTGRIPLVTFVSLGGVLDDPVFDVTMEHLDDAKAIMVKFADWQRTSAENNIRNVEKPIGEILYTNYAGDVPSATVVEFVFRIDGAGSAMLYAKQKFGGCRSTRDPGLCRSASRRGGFISPEEAAEIIYLVDNFGSLSAQGSGADLLK